MDENDKKLMQHEYDGIQELDNDLPGWWIMLFWITIIFGIAYMVYFHVLYPGKNQEAEFKEAMAKAEKAQQARIAAMGGGVQIEYSAELLKHAEKGKETFTLFCVACHGTMGQGTQCPNLTDSHFLYGFEYENIKNIITEGSAKNPAMMAWKTTLTPTQIQDVSAYVYTLRGKNFPGKPAEGTDYKIADIQSSKSPQLNASSAEPVSTKPMTPEEKTKSLYMACSACHGPDGAGNILTKAPALAGQDVLYLTRQIMNFKEGKRVSKEPLAAGMLPLLGTLKEEDVKLLAEYIHKLKPASIAHTEKGDAVKGQAQYALCGTCHGLKGEGNPMLKGPRLTGLQDWYIVSQLKAFKEGHRGADPAKEPEGAMMAPMAKIVVDEQAMKDIAEYIKTLK